MKLMINLGFDFDGTIIDHGPTKLRLCQQLGKHIELWEANSNLFEQRVGQEIYKKVSHVLYRQETAAGKNFPDVRQALWSLWHSGNNIFIVSARHPDSCHCATEWLEENGFLSSIKSLTVRFCKESEKPRILQELGISIYVDDKISVLQSLPPSIKKILFDDQFLVAMGSISVPDGIKVVTNWSDVHSLIQKLSVS